LKITVINLARSKDRRELIQSNLTRLGLEFEFFTAIDASCGEHERISRYDETLAWRELDRPLHPGEIACFASHYVLWQRCVAAQETYVVMEDDIVVDEGFTQALAVSLELLSAFPLIRLSLTREASESKPIMSLPHDFELVSLARHSFGTQCYILSPIGAQVLIEHAVTWPVPVDVFFDRPELNGLGNYGLRPYFVRHADQTTYPSLIGDNRYGPWPSSHTAQIQARVRNYLSQRRPVPADLVVRTDGDL
jgi:glycosyl transferase family 25